MKQLLVMALLVIGSFSAKAQMVTNNTMCTFEYRALCIDRNTCVATPTTGWLTAPVFPSVNGPLVTPPCGLNSELGYEVRYASPASCATTTYTLQMTGSPMTCLPVTATLPPCGSCLSGAIVVFDRLSGTGAPWLTFN